MAATFAWKGLFRKQHPPLQEQGVGCLVGAGPGYKPRGCEGWKSAGSVIQAGNQLGQ